MQLESAYVGTLSWCGKSKWLFGFFSWKAVNCGFTAVDTQKKYILQTSKNPTCYCIFALQLPECPGGLFLQCHRNAVHRTGKRSAGTLLDWLATCQLIKIQPLVTGSNISTVPTSETFVEIIGFGQWRRCPAAVHQDEEKMHLLGFYEAAFAPQP